MNTFISYSLKNAIAKFESLYSEADFAMLFQISPRKFAMTSERCAIKELSSTAKLIALKNIY